jgi:hypothetical protein
MSSCASYTPCLFSLYVGDICGRLFPMSRAGSKPFNGGVLGLYPSHVSK